jgi:hypothetical protein
MQFLDFQKKDLTLKMFREQAKVKRIQLPSDTKKEEKDIIDRICKICTPNAAAIITDEYKKSLKSHYTMDKVSTNEVHLQTKDNTYIVKDTNKNVPICNCSEALNYMVPCRNVFYCKRATCEEIVVEEMIPARWRNKANEIEEEVINYHNEQTDNIVIMPSINETVPKNPRSRYNNGLRVAQELAQLVAKSPSKYNDRYLTISMLLQFWQSDIEIKITPVTTESTQTSKKFL